MVGQPKEYTSRCEEGSAYTKRNRSETQNKKLVVIQGLGEAEMGSARIVGLPKLTGWIGSKRGRLRAELEKKTSRLCFD